MSDCACVWDPYSRRYLSHCEAHGGRATDIDAREHRNELARREAVRQARRERLSMKDPGDEFYAITNIVFAPHDPRRRRPR